MPENPERPADPPREPSAGIVPAATSALVRGDALSAMSPRFNLFFRWFAHRFFRHFGLDPETVRRLRELESRGSVVYVMRYASRLDYFLFNALFRREGLRLSRFANGIRFYYYRPFWEAFKTMLTRPRGLRREEELAHARETASELALAGQSFFLFLRTARRRPSLRGRRGALEQGKSERDLLTDVVSAVWNAERPVSLVPLALFWKKGPRSSRRFLNLSYGATTRPTDFAKVTSFLTTYRGLFVKVGDPIDLQAFIEARREGGPEAVARVVRRSILTYLYREEKVVEGPTLRPRHRVQEEVVRDARVDAVIHARASERKESVERARAEAEKMFREIAANMNSTFLGLLDAAVGVVMRRLFQSIEVSGIQKVAEYAKRHPLVLVPSHRSYFDFLIISSLFYNRHLVPPHIAARENMGFGPFGFLFRRAGAFFMRRSFEDPLYKEVFRAYVAHLIREGFTQEFFIEGGRSRTGKTLNPRLGILSWNVEAFLGSARRDLFFVPIAIAYERLVEEGAMVGELEGERKRDESVLGLVRARKFLRRRFGSVFVNFGEPISLAESLGGRREAFHGLELSPDVESDKRRFIEGLGNRIAERINWAVVPNATSVAACALLGERRRGLFRADLVRRMQELVDLLRLQDVRLTPALARDEGDFADSISSLLRSDLIRSVSDPRGEVLYFEESRRRALDLYRNSIVHYLAAPSLLARQLLSGATLDELRRDLAAWLDLFYVEFFTPRGEVMAAHFGAFIDHFERFGRVERSEDRLRSTEKGVGYFRFLAEQTRGFMEAYYTTFGAVLRATGELSARDLRKSAGEQFDHAQLLGEVDRREAANDVTFANAIETLVRRCILEVVPVEPGDRRVRDVTYRRGPAFDDLIAIHERLATALAAR